MQIHELNTFTGTPGNTDFLPTDNGSDTRKISATDLVKSVNDRIDNLITSPAPTAEEIIDARLGANGVTYPTLGGAIRGQVADLNSDITKNFNEIHTNNMVDATSIVEGYGVSTSTGNLVALNGYFATDFIEVQPETIYKSNAGRNAAWYDSTKTFISGVNGTGIQNGLLSPANAKYCRFAVNKSTDGMTDATTLYFTAVGDFVNPAHEEETNNILYYPNKVLLQNVVGVSKFPNNLCDPSECIDGYYISTVNGVLVGGSGYFCTPYIPVTAGNTYKANKGRNLAWYDSTKTFISGVSGTAIQNGVTAPNDASYIRFSINKTNDTDSPFEIYFTDSQYYDTSVYIDGLGAGQWCHGKKINWLGDSIVDGQDFDEEVCSALGLVKNNEYGINGSTIALRGDGTDTRNALCARYSSMTDDADIVAVSCGTNDFMYAWCPIGTIDDADDGTSNTTFYGALKALCKGLIDKYPQKVIFFTTPIKRAQSFADGNGGTYTADGVMTTPFSKNKYGLTLMDYADIIIEVCGYYSIPVLDMNRESLLNPHLASQQNMFDGLYTHPNATGQKIMARRVAGWLTQLGYVIK